MKVKFNGPDWLHGMPKAVEKLAKGEAVAIGSKIYQVCWTCRQVIQVNKPFIDSMHFCAPQ